MTRMEMELCLFGLNRFGDNSIEYGRKYKNIAYGFVYIKDEEGSYQTKVAVWFERNFDHNWTAKVELKSPIDRSILTEVKANTVYEFEGIIAAFLGKSDVSSL